MMKTKVVSGVVLGIALGILVSSGPMLAQGPDVLNTLVVEIRGLRAAIEQMTSANARVQLAMGRLQLQEQRVNTLLRRLDDLRQSRATAEREASRVQDEITRLEEMAPRADPGERRGLEQAMRDMKAMAPVHAADAQRLAAQEAEAAALVSAEQRRWNEFNQQLEELDRTLRR